MTQTKQTGRKKLYKDPRRLEVRLCGEEYDWLYAYCRKHGASMTSVARRALHKFTQMPLVGPEV